MPELKHNFLRGRMNKDFDERLVPNGEYRDALNVEVSTSEASEVGTVQNIKGNVKVTKNDQKNFAFMSTSTSNNAITIGSIADESTKAIYNFIYKASDLAQSGESFTTGAKFLGVRSDVITEYIADETAESGTTYPLVVDVYEVRSEADIQTSQNGIIKGLHLDAQVISTAVSTIIYFPEGVRVGMRVQLIGPDGLDIYAGEDIRVKAINSSESQDSVSIETNIPNIAFYYNQELKDAGFVFKFTADRILKFKAGTTETESNTTNTPKSNTPYQTSITGINIEDGILFFTDGKNEPKRIVIKRFKTDLNKYVANARINKHSEFYFDNKFLHFKKPFEEKHITVIRPNPLEPPAVEAIFTNREPGPHVFADVTYADTVVASVGEISSAWDEGDAGDFKFASGYLAVLDSPGDTFWVRANIAKINWLVNDILELVGNESGSVATCKVMEWAGGFDWNYNVFLLSFIDISESYYETNPNGNNIVLFEEEAWIATLKEKDVIYGEKFLYFAYRYKYLDNEYSCISPYSKAIFSPGIYSYNSISGINIGMENKLKSVVLKDFIPKNIPYDVSEVEILFRESNSDNVYKIKTIQHGSDDWSFSTLDNYKGHITIDSEIFGATLPSSQLVRIYDNVPRKSQSQEFSSSRLLFGNYTEGYNLLDGGLNDIKPKVDQDFDIVAFPSDFNSTYLAENILNASWSEDSGVTKTKFDSTGGIDKSWNVDWWGSWSHPNHSNFGETTLAHQAVNHFITWNPIPIEEQPYMPIVNCGINASLEEDDPSGNYDNSPPVFLDGNYDEPRGPHYNIPTNGGYTFEASIDLAYNDHYFDTGTFTGNRYTSDLFRMA